MIRVAVAPSVAPVCAASEFGESPHVLLVVDQFPRTLGGGERAALRLAALLPDYGFRVSILTFFAHPESPALVQPPCPIRVIPLRRTWNLPALRAAMELGQFLKRDHVRIVQTFFESSDIWAGLVAKALSSAKLVWSRRDMGILRSRKHDIAYRFLSGIPDAVFCVSEKVRQHCIKNDHVTPAKLQTIYNGIDVAGWENPTPGKDSRAKVVTTVGNIRRVKGHDTLIRAAALIVERFPGVTFRIVGDVLEPDYFRELQALASQLDLQAHVYFVSGVRDLHSHLAESDVFVLPSRSEGFSNALIEAMAASLPIVATDVGGNAEAIRDGASGYVVPADQPGLLAEAILRLLSNPAMAAAMGKAARRCAEEQFSIQSMMGRICNSYKRLLGG